jgi:hypothetical protein
MSMKMNQFCLLTHQAELVDRRSQTGVWEREFIQKYVIFKQVAHQFNNHGD